MINNIVEIKELISKSNMYEDIEFSNLYHKKLLKFLCNDEEELENIFIEAFYIKQNINKSVLNFQKFLYNLKNRNINTNINLFNRLIYKRDWQGLHSELQKCFLDIIDFNLMYKFKNLINQGLTGEDIVCWTLIENNKDLNIITYPIDYIKENTLEYINDDKNNDIAI